MILSMSISLVMAGLLYEEPLLWVSDAEVVHWKGIMNSCRDRGQLCTVSRLFIGCAVSQSNTRKDLHGTTPSTKCLEHQLRSYPKSKRRHDSIG